MIKLFFTTFFIAELIIAFALVAKIYKLNRIVNTLNTQITDNRPLIKEILIGFQDLFKEFSASIDIARNFIKRKKQEYLFNTAKTLVMYIGFFMLKGKYKKSILAYQLACEIYDGIKEFDS